MAATSLLHSPAKLGEDSGAAQRGNPPCSRQGAAFEGSAPVAVKASQASRRAQRHRHARSVQRGRVESLVPIRYGRMLHSPFAFLRGSASIMAFDLRRTPACGIHVQACGDAHLMNFGGFATPERHLVFDVNDFDETLVAPWEWDLKRLATSITVAGRHLGFSKMRNAEATMAAVAAYRGSMTVYATMHALELWYQRIDATQVAELHFSTLAKNASDAPPHPVTEHLFPKVTEAAGTMRQIREELPLVYRPRKGDESITQRQAAARGLSSHAVGGSARTARSLRTCRCRHQGRRRGQRRHPLRHCAAHGRRR